MRTLQFFSCPSSFFRKEKNKEKAGKHKGGISEQNNMDPDHVISGMGITGSNRESIYCLLHLHYNITLFYLYLYNTGSLYYTNIQYTQLLHWASI